MTLNRRTFFASLTAALFVANSARAAEPLPPFMLEDVNGQVVDDATLQGRVSLVLFGYTSCPDVCPTAMMKMADVLKSLAADGDKVLPLFISLDPKRDTRKILSAYAANFDPRIVPLRGPEPYVDAAANAFGVTYRIVTPDAAHPDEYSVDHTALIFLVAPDGSIVERFGHETAADVMAKRIREVLATAGN